MDYSTSVFSTSNSNSGLSKPKRNIHSSVSVENKSITSNKRQKLLNNRLEIEDKSYDCHSNTSISSHLDTIHQVLLRRSPYFSDTSDAETSNEALADIINIPELIINRRTYLTVPQYSLNCLNLSDKETLMYLIERNVSNSILAPYDLYAYTKLTNTPLESLLAKISVFDKYNSLKIKKSYEMSKTYSLNSKTYLKSNSFIPNAISAFLSPFFLEIFTVSDLEQLGSKCVRKMLNLRGIHIHRSSLHEQLFENISQNILWNIITLYKFKIKCDNPAIRMGLFNFYLSYVYILTHLECLIHSDNEPLQANLESYIRKTNELRRLLPMLLQALYQNGLFKNEDFHAFKQFCAERQTKMEQNSLENKYYTTAIEQISSSMCTISPLSLASLCRLKIKSSLNVYDLEEVSQLQLSKPVISFLMFDEELRTF